MRALSNKLLFCALAGLALATLSSDAARAGWPPAPGANMQDKSNWPNDFDGSWKYISYLPKQDPGTRPYLAADVKLGASGVSVDKAWTYTIGRDDVHIAVLDSGIEWDQPDLVNKVWLNPVELATHKPKAKDGSVCGGAGALAGFDCNKDGIFTVADYRDDPSISPIVVGDKCIKSGDVAQPGGDRIAGDVNHNCILDPGDLIRLYSDSTDDDANGYTDDIAGWDFLKNDNDPYDDTRYGHGTGEARDSSAEGNNGIDTIGMCPGCRFTPLRVGDSFIADSNDFGKAVVYASDNGYSVIQEALGTLNQTAFSKAAIDYAYNKGLLVVASMADENSRHHNMPATANHVLTVHTVRYNGASEHESTSFLNFDTCTNYGAQLSLSIAGVSCSSEATGRASGVAGLLYSMAAVKGLKLSSEEAIQLFKMNADDIDVAESRSDNPDVSGQFYQSQAGFDQRFGYGRANAARIMQSISDGLIPPEVEIVSPEWFTPVFADRVTGSIELRGRVAAARAQSYDVKIEWAPGVQPLEAEYKPLVSSLANVAAGTITGGTTPLATFDPKQLDTAHPKDPDSKHGENDRSISLRVHAIAHYSGGKDVHGEARRVISITNEKNGLDRDLLPGFPIKAGGSAESSPKLVDIDGDGIRDIVYPTSDGSIHALTMRTGSPVELPGFPYRTQVIDGLNPNLSSEPTVPSYRAAPAYQKGAANGIDPDSVRESVMSAPGVMDLDGDGKNEIVITSWPGTVYVIDSKGQDAAGWPKRMPLVPSCSPDPAKPSAGPCMDLTHGILRGIYGAPVIADINKDKKLEIIVASFDSLIHAYEVDGKELDGFPVNIHSSKATKTNRIMTTPTVADFNGDGTLDIATGSNEEIGGGGGAGPVFIVDGRGNKAPSGPYLPNWPITMVSLHLFPVVAEGVDSSQAAADFDGDGRPDLLAQGNGAPPFVLKGDPGAQPGFGDPPNRLPERTDSDGNAKKGFVPGSVFGEYSGATSPDTFFPLFSQPSIGDVDQDGVPDVIMSGGSLSLAGNLAGGATARPFQHLMAMWSGKTGKMMPGAPIVIEDYTFLLNQAIADITGDDYPEVITGSGGYFLHALDACAHEAEGFPKFTNGWIAAGAAVGDLDGDHSLEIVSGTRDGYIFAWHTRGRDDGVIAWESFHHDNGNTGDYGVKLPQGVLKRAAEPIDCTPPVAPTQEQFGLGGCSSTTATRGARKGGIPAGIAVALGALLYLRTRRRRRAS